MIRNGNSCGMSCCQVLYWSLAIAAPVLEILDECTLSVPDAGRHSLLRDIGAAPGSARGVGTGRPPGRRGCTKAGHGYLSPEIGGTGTIGQALASISETIDADQSAGRKREGKARVAGK